jgi:hypothetical protein
LFSPDDDDSPVTYTVSFSPGEGTGSAPDNQKIAAGGSLTLPNKGNMTAPAGKDFGGWKDDTGVHGAGASVTITEDTVFTALWTGGNPDDPDDKTAIYKSFYEYPEGRVDSAGLLNIVNAVASEALVFHTEVEAGNYIGTISPLGSITVKLPEEKFYIIVAVEKKQYEEQGAKATQSSVRTYYSKSLKYTARVSPLSSYGAGTWIINNGTDYWVELRRPDGNGNHAVIAPNSQRVSIPVELNTPYDYHVYFSKELRFNENIVALVDTTDPSQNNTAQVDKASEPYTTTILPADVPRNNIKPAVMVKNNSDKSVRVYYSNSQKTNGAAAADFVITGGKSAMISGFEIGNDTASINFGALAWTAGNKYVPESMTMESDKIYEITIPKDENAANITVEEVPSSKYYQ